MKKLTYSLMLLALVAAGCDKHEVNPESKNEETSGTRLVTIKGVQDLTKTSYANDKTFSWEAGDQVSVLFHNGEEAKFFTFTTESAGASATFSASIPSEYEIGAPGTGTKWALYPASESHVYTSDTDIAFYLPAGGDGNTARIPMIAQGTSEDTFAFTQMSGALKFTINNIRSEVSKVRIDLNTETWYVGKLVSGLFAIQGLDSSAPKIQHDKPVLNESSKAKDASDKTYVIADVKDQTAVVYMPLPIATLAPFYTVTISDANTGSTLYTKHFPGGAGNLVVQQKKISQVNALTLEDVDRSEMIQVDGYFDDWNDITGTTYSGVLSDLKAVSDGENFWMYFKLDRSKFNISYWNMYVTFYINTDNDDTTGNTANGDWQKGSETMLQIRYAQGDDATVNANLNKLAFRKWDSEQGKFVDDSTAPVSAYKASDDGSCQQFEMKTTLSTFGISPGSQISIGFLGYTPEFRAGGSNRLVVDIPAAE